MKQEEEPCVEEGATEDAEFAELSVGEFRAIPECTVQLEMWGVHDLPAVGQSVLRHGDCGEAGRALGKEQEPC